MGMHQALLGQTYGDGIRLSSQYIGDYVVDPDNATASYQLTSTGNVESITGAGTVVLDTWILITANAGLYEVRVTPTTGTFSSGVATGVWLALTSNQIWGVQRNAIGNRTCIFTVEIRLASSGVVMATTSCTVEADVS